MLCFERVSDKPHVIDYSGPVDVVNYRVGNVGMRALEDGELWKRLESCIDCGSARRDLCGVGAECRDACPSPTRMES